MSEVCSCERSDCIATQPPPEWHAASLGVNEFGTPVSIHICRGCGHEFTVCPANLDHDDACLGDTCATYDIARDIDMFFEPAIEAGLIRRGEGTP